MSSIGGNKKRTRNSPSNKRYKTAGRSQINKLKRIAKEKKKMERARTKKKIREEKKKEVLKTVEETKTKDPDKTDHLGPLY